MEIIYFLSGFLIFFTLIGYPLVLVFLSKIIKKDIINSSETFNPSVTIIIPAHNEESVIKNKLKNLISLDYKKNIEIIIASDNSTDDTNAIVETFIKENSNFDISLYKVQERKGKTNAQNETVKIAKGDILIFSDANSILDKNAVKEIVSYFNDLSIGYVAGKLSYSNSYVAESSETENNYWSYDLLMRKIESDIASITAGNGALYGVRKIDYVDINLVQSHDSIFPQKMVLKNKKAKYNEKAIAHEKAGEVSEDEFKRKVRMSRQILSISFSDISKYNIFKYGWFSFFYFSHRLLRNNLYLLHIIFYVSNLLIMNESFLFFVIFILQSIFYLLAILGIKYKSKLFYLPFYYSMTIFAQLVGAKNELTGKSKPFWEKAESTR
ncbi:glycosyltransferase [Carnobacterium gallinarum]|uniref:glycosyltransferase n=1 Tax=Carnobacterium gallinarum TaxID=2749 RepID=UPI00068DD1CC|nr:glycosyltransferase [Carnobacterium gallinarum]